MQLGPPWGLLIQAGARSLLHSPSAFSPQHPAAGLQVPHSGTCAETESY